MQANAVTASAELAHLLRGLLFLRDSDGRGRPSATAKAVVAVLLCHSGADLTCTVTERELCADLDVTEKTLRKFLREAEKRGLLTISKKNRYGQKRYNLRPLAEALKRQLARQTVVCQRPSVYLLLDGTRRLLKIGYTEDLRRRMSQVAAASGNGAIDILATITAGRDVERALIDEFSKYRIAGEWFHYRPEIVDRFLEIRSVLGSEDCAPNATNERRV